MKRNAVSGIYFLTTADTEKHCASLAVKEKREDEQQNIRTND